MLQSAKIKIRDIKELQGDNSTPIASDLLNTTVLRKRKNLRKVENSNKKNNETEVLNNKIVNDKIEIKTKRIPGTAKKFVSVEQPATQKRIDSYFSTCQKTFKIKDESPTPLGKNGGHMVAREIKSVLTKASNRKGNNNRRTKKGRKRLFADSTTETDTTVSCLSTCHKDKKKISRRMPKIESIIVSDSEEEYINHDLSKTLENQEEIPKIESTTVANGEYGYGSPDLRKTLESQKHISTLSNENPKTSLSKKAESHNDSAINNNSASTSSRSKTNTIINNATPMTCASTTSTSTVTFSRRKPKPCPPYKVIEETTFAVDAFQFGYIENVTHYFLTHFHADHYIGLTKSFAMPIYMSPITARFLRAFIPVEETYIHELELNQTYTINNIKVTALDANHCPGSILLVFELPNNKCILHTGDFRAWHGMESEPIFWNNHIHTIYLDTTYLSDKYAFCTQDESLLKAYGLLDKFQEKHPDKRILYICGSYVIGKEKFWSKLAENYKLKVWAEGNRYKALKALNDEHINELLVEQPQGANMHVIAMGKLSYLHLVEYFKNFEHLYDLVFAIRPSGWEKDTKPQYRGKINIVGVEYSEHSSYNEMKRFVKFLKPDKVLSTVPTGRDLMNTAKVPLNWYKYSELKSCSNYQPTITTYLNKTPQMRNIRPPNLEMDGMENFVSPLKPTRIGVNSLTKEQIQSLHSADLSEKAEQHTLKDRIKGEIRKKNDNNENCSIFISKTSTDTSTSKLFANNSSEEFEKPSIDLIQKRTQHTKRHSIQENDTENTRKVQERNNNLIKKTSVKTISNKKSSNTQNQNDTYVEKQSNVAQIRRTSQRKATKRKSTNEEIKVGNTMNVKQELVPSETIPNSSKLASYSTPKLTNAKSTPIQQKQNLSEESPISSKFASLQRNKIKCNKKQQKTIQTDYASEEEFEATTAPITRAKKEEILTTEEIPASQRVVSNQKSRTFSTSSKIEFEKQLQIVTTKQNNKKNSKKKSHQSLLKKSMRFKENPILKSTTTTSITSSTEEIPATQNTNNFRILRNKCSKNISRNSNKGSDEDFGIEGNESNLLNKSRQDLTVLRQCLTPLKDSNQPLDTQVILKTIMANNEDLEQYNPSQLAELVEEVLNENNPDKSRDHVPVDLLSEESVPDHTNHMNHINELLSSSSSEHEKQLLTLNDSNLIQFDAPKSSKENIPNDLLYNKDDKSVLNHINELPSTSLSGRKRHSLARNSHSFTHLNKIQKSNCHKSNDLVSKTDNHISDLPSSSVSEHRRPSLTSIAQNLTPLKESKQPLDTKAILKTIIDTNEGDLNQINCSQMAGHILETLNKQNPDSSKDHIPVDLLSDADDDWM